MSNTLHCAGTVTGKLRSLYGLKWNPFSADLPIGALVTTPGIESFLWRIEQSHVHEGGFALVSGDPGTGKSVVLRLAAERLERLREVTVAALAHPQSNIADFYRETGDLFGVQLRPHNRWGGFKALCEHALGNYRVLTTMAGELLTMAAERELKRLDEKLYFEVFAADAAAGQTSRPRLRGGRRR